MPGICVDLLCGSTAHRALQGLWRCGVEHETGGRVAAPSVVVVHRVGQPTDPPHDGQGAVAQAIELGQAAGLEARGHHDRVGTRDEPVRTRLVVTDVRVHAPRVRLLRHAECRFQRGFAGALQHQLNARSQHLGQRSQHQVQPLLRCQPADDGQHQRLPIRGQPEFGLQCLPACVLALQAIGVVALGNGRVGRRVPDPRVDAVEDAADMAAAAADDTVEAAAELVRRDFARVGRAHGSDVVSKLQAGLHEAELAMEFES